MIIYFLPLVSSSTILILILGMSHDASDRGERIASLLRERGNAETEKLPFSRYLDIYRYGKTRKGKVTDTLGVNVSLGQRVGLDYTVCRHSCRPTPSPSTSQSWKGRPGSGRSPAGDCQYEQSLRYITYNLGTVQYTVSTELMIAIVIISYHIISYRIVSF